MPSTYSRSLRIELIAAGEQAGTWNITTNRNLGEIIEQAITGVETINITSGDRTLLALNAAVDEARNAVIVFTGLPADTTTVTVPNVNKEYTIRNMTDQTVIIQPEASASTYECPPNSTNNVVVDGGDGSVHGVSISDAVSEMLRQPDFDNALATMGAAALESPAFTGNPTAPTQPPGTNNTTLATTEFVRINGVPKGAITLWYGTTIPDGWYECNGQNGTPDLRGVFPLGSSSAYPMGSTGGSPDAVLVSHNHGGITGSQNRNHSHSGSTSNAGNHSHPYTDMYDNPNAGGWGHSGSSGVIATANRTTGSAGAHTHTFTTGVNDANHEHSISTQGESGVGKNMPPYLAVRFIMKG